MKRHHLLILFVLIGVNLGYGQTGTNSAPIKWEQYRAAEYDISVLFPKMPVRVSGGDSCSRIRSDLYLVYSADVIYGAGIYSKSELKLPGYCTETVDFDKNRFPGRIRELTESLPAIEEKNIKINGKMAVFLTNGRYRYWLFNDYENKRWIELFVVNASENDRTLKDFAESLKIGKNSGGTDIGNGASRMLADELTETQSTELAEKDMLDESTRKVVFISKPPPKYTDIARKNNTQGTVKLHVTFLANGTIGGISPVETLPNGLTEQAIAATRKIVFLPARRKGTRFSVTMTIHYVFSIY